MDDLRLTRGEDPAVWCGVMVTGGVVMRRVVGALIIFVLVALHRADDISHFWRPLGRADLSAPPPVSVTPPHDPPEQKRGARTRQTVPLDYRRNPLRFLSRAPADSLTLLPGVGPVIADRIIGARTGKRSFTKWEDLLAIKGIGPKTLERMKRLAGAANP